MGACTTSNLGESPCSFAFTNLTVSKSPGWKRFLEDAATKYEMHVYTMGTRAYAEEVCAAIDPDKKIFGGRLLSRDESGSLTQKSLQRLFPCDTSMVVIIDDRADVWEWSPNLIKVIPCRYTRYDPRSLIHALHRRFFCRHWRYQLILSPKNPATWPSGNTGESTARSGNPARDRTDSYTGGGRKSGVGNYRCHIGKLLDPRSPSRRASFGQETGRIGGLS